MRRRDFVYKPPPEEASAPDHEQDHATYGDNWLPLIKDELALLWTRYKKAVGEVV